MIIDGKNYYYRVTEFVTTFGKDPGGNDSFSDTKEFDNPGDLWRCRKEALNYHNSRQEGLQKSKYFLPFASPENFVTGKHAAYSIDVYLVEVHQDGEEEEIMLNSGDSIEEEENIRFEEKILYKSIGIELPEIP